MKSLKRVWDRSLPRPVGETGRRSVGNGKERLRDYAGFPDRQPNVPMREAPISKNLRGTGGRKSQGALARLCEFPVPKVTIEIPVYFDRISAFSQQAARCAGPKGMRGNPGFLGELA